MNAEIMKALLREGASKNVFDDEGMTPLMLAAKSGRVNMMNILLEGGADPNVCMTKRPFSTAMHSAAAFLNLPAMEILLLHGAKVGAGDNQGSTSLHYVLAVTEGVLVDARVPLLHHTALELKKNAVKLLLRWGADEMAVSLTGQTPTDMIVEDDTGQINLLLARAPMDRAWRRRGWLVMLRVRNFSEDTSSIQSQRSEDDGSARLDAVVHKLVRLSREAERVFRKIVSFL